MDETTPPVPVDEDSPLHDMDPVPADPTDEPPTSEPPPEWDPAVHAEAYAADPEVDNSPVGDEG